METQIITEPVTIKRGTDFQKITPFLWFEIQAEDVANFYTTLFNNSMVKMVTYYGEEGAKASGRPKGTVMTVSFQIEGQEFVAINGGPVFSINPTISFFVNCESPKEIDRLWAKLSDGGEIFMELNKYPFSEKYGWLQDKYGLSWQVVPAALGELLGDPDPVKSGRVMQAMLQMKKIDINTLQLAYDLK